MERILVSGLINLETTLHVDGFPVEYTPVRYPSEIEVVGMGAQGALKCAICQFI